MKLKILAVHGHHQNAQRFREKSGQFRKALQSLAEFVFIDSPIQEGDLTTLKEPSEERQTWFTTTEDNYYTRDHPITGYNKTFEDSSQFFRNFIQENGPFDGILAFSQGCAFTHALLKQGSVPSLRFVIFCCGFMSRGAAPFVDNSEISDLPTFHCVNTNDQVIPNTMSEALAHVFTNPFSVIKHYECGHCLPTPKLCKTDLIEFLSGFQ